MRRVCMDMLADYVKKLQPTDTDRLVFCLEFLKKSLKDESKWVRNTASQNYGKVVYEVYLKA